MEVEVPEKLKADVPQTTWGKILTATPVVMAVVSTMLAGMSASEMTRAQYDRSYAAQMQSKAADQWAFFQAKRLRGATQRSTLDVLQSTTDVRPLSPEIFKSIAGSQDASLDSTDVRKAIGYLEKGALPELSPAPTLDPAIQAANDAVANFKPESEIKSLLVKVNDAAVDAALQSAVDRTRQFDAALKSVNQAIDQLETALARNAGMAQERRDFTAARLRFTGLRYDAESRLNQAIAELYELKVRKNNISAERHHDRSQSFFYGMLAAQMAVIVATFAIAARQRNLLWTLAAIAGAVAVAIAVYVYVWV